VDPLHVREERNALSPEWEPGVEAADVRNVLAELRAEDVERSEARTPHVVVAHAAIISPPTPVGSARSWPSML
jgi:hypothetical protein